jgi:hypothetical protein
MTPDSRLSMSTTTATDYEKADMLRRLRSVAPDWLRCPNTHQERILIALSLDGRAERDTRNLNYWREVSSHAS